MDIEKTIRALTGRGFAVQHFATGREAADYLDGAIDGTTVGIGGSKTIDQIGLYDRLARHNTVWWHWRTPGFDTLDHALTAPVYLSSANAITEDGQILNIDGRGNRLAAMVYGIGKTVYIVAGTNKICPDFDSALSRATPPPCRTCNALTATSRATRPGAASTAAARAAAATRCSCSGDR